MRSSVVRPIHRRFYGPIGCAIFVNDFWRPYSTKWARAVRHTPSTTITVYEYIHSRAIRENVPANGCEGIAAWISTPMIYVDKRDQPGSTRTKNLYIHPFYNTRIGFNVFPFSANDQNRYTELQRHVHYENTDKESTTIRLVSNEHYRIGNITLFKRILPWFIILIYYPSRFLIASNVELNILYYLIVLMKFLTLVRQVFSGFR